MFPCLLLVVFALCNHAVNSEDCCAPPLQASHLKPPVVKVTRELFGETDGDTVYRYNLSAPNIKVQVTNYGGYLMSVVVPDRSGREQDIVLGYDNLQSYVNTTPLIGAIVGRVANRIRNSTFTLDGKTYNLSHPVNRHFFHGGDVGWNKIVWNSSVLADGVSLSLFSPDGDENFPGNVEATVTYRITADGLLISVRAVTDQATPINVYSHCFFNLAGHAAGPKGVNATRVTIHSSQYYPLDWLVVPYGPIESVNGTDLDFCTPRLLGDALAKMDYDDLYILSRCNSSTGQMLKVASAEHSPSGRTMELYSDQPHMEFYTANGLPDPARTDQSPVIGKGGVHYQSHGGFLFIDQNFFDPVVDTLNDEPILRPGEVYQHNMLYKFGVH